MAEQGITSYLDASVGKTELAALAALSDRGPLTIRPSVAITVAPSWRPSRRRCSPVSSGCGRSTARPGVTIRTVKMFFDGVIEHPTQTAALLTPYRVNKGTKRHPHWVAGKSRGPTYFRQAVANRGIGALDAAGWQVHIHAIGDRAVRSALDAFESRARQRGRQPPHDHPPRAGEPEGLPPLRALGVLASMQLHWAERDSYTVDAPQAVHRPPALALHVPGRQPRAGRRTAVWRK